MGNKEEKNNTVPNGSMEITGRRHKSARPGRISYVPISDEDLAPYEPVSYTHLTLPTKA